MNKLSIASSQVEGTLKFACLPPQTMRRGPTFYLNNSFPLLTQVMRTVKVPIAHFAISGQPAAYSST